MKTPDLPPFSGTDPVPKDEGSWEQWEFQVKGFLDTHTPEAVRSAIVHSVRGVVCELVGFVGYQADLGTILKAIEKLLGKKTNRRQAPTGFLPVESGKGREGKNLCGEVGTVISETAGQVPRKV